MPISQMLEPGRPLSRADIEAVESRLGRKLPAAYAEFLLRHNGGRPQPAVFSGPHSEDEDSVHYFHSVGAGDVSDLADEAGFFHDYHDLDRDLLPIARTPQGNLVCIAIGERKRGQIFFWSHDHPDRSESTYKLADDLDAFLASFHELELDWPSQVHLDELFSRAVAYEVVDASHGVDAGRVIAAGRSPGEVRALHAALTIAGGGGRCMCAGDATLRILVPAGSGSSAEIGLHHGTSIRWDDRWLQDARLASPDALADLFAVQGWTRYRDERKEREQRATRDDAAESRWLAAMPAALRPMAGVLMNPFGVLSDDVLQKARAALVAAEGSEVEAARALLGWYGGGRGEWSGFPAYESTARHLLMSFSVTALVNALDGGLDLPRADGAARLFTDHDFRRNRTKLPRTVVERLHAHVVAQGDADRIGAFAAAFRMRP